MIGEIITVAGILFGLILLFGGFIESAGEICLLAIFILIVSVLGPWGVTYDYASNNPKQIAQVEFTLTPIPGVEEAELVAEYDGEVYRETLTGKEYLLHDRISRVFIEEGKSRHFWHEFTYRGLDIEYERPN